MTEAQLLERLRSEIEASKVTYTLKQGIVGNPRVFMTQKGGEGFSFSLGVVEDPAVLNEKGYPLRVWYAVTIWPKRNGAWTSETYASYVNSGDTLMVGGELGLGKSYTKHDGSIVEPLEIRNAHLYVEIGNAPSSDGDVPEPAVKPVERPQILRPTTVQQMQEQEEDLDLILQINALAGTVNNIAVFNWIHENRYPDKPNDWLAQLNVDEMQDIVDNFAIYQSASGADGMSADDMILKINSIVKARLSGLSSKTDKDAYKQQFLDNVNNVLGTETTAFFGEFADSLTQSQVAVVLLVTMSL